MLKAELAIALLDSRGRLLKEIKQPSRSFVSQFIEMFYVWMSALDLTIKDIDNTDRNYAAHNVNLDDMLLGAPGGDVTVHLCGQASGAESAYNGDLIGIQVGTGSTAADANDYKMETRIAHGPGAGQFYYAGSEIERPVISAPNASFLLRRYFNNKSGGGITVNEAGIYAPKMMANGDAYLHLMCRDVIGGGIAVANNELLRVQYTTQVTV